MWLEVGIVVTTLTLYVEYAFNWHHSLGEDIHLGFCHNDTDCWLYLPVVIGCIIWGMLGVIAVVASIVGHIFFFVEHTKRLSLLAGLHILYHLIRWPIFAAMVVAAVDYTHVEETWDNPDVNDHLVAFAVWLDLIVIIVVLAVGGTIYACVTGVE